MQTYLCLHVFECINKYTEYIREKRNSYLYTYTYTYIYTKTHAYI